MYPRPPPNTKAHIGSEAVIMSTYCGIDMLGVRGPVD